MNELDVLVTALAKSDRCVCDFGLPAPAECTGECKTCFLESIHEAAKGDDDDVMFIGCISYKS